MLIGQFKENLHRRMIQCMERGEDLSTADGITVAPTLPTGKSMWARWVREGILKPHQVVWAFRAEGYRQWLAVLLDVGLGGRFFIDLTSDRISLSEMEQAFFIKMQGHQNTGLCPLCNSVMTADANGRLICLTCS